MAHRQYSLLVSGPFSELAEKFLGRLFLRGGGIEDAVTDIMNADVVVPRRLKRFNAYNIAGEQLCKVFTCVGALGSSFACFGHKWRYSS